MDIDPDRLIPAITGRTIVGGDIGDSGFHLFLDDNRVLIFTGMFVIGLLNAEERTIQ